MELDLDSQVAGERLEPQRGEDGHHARAEPSALAADERLVPAPPPVVVDRRRVRQFHFEHGGVSARRFPGGSAR